MVKTFDGFRCAGHPPREDEFRVPVFREPRRGDTVSRGPDGVIRIINSEGALVEPTGYATRDGWGLHVDWSAV
jgi:hypothetical protein